MKSDSALLPRVQPGVTSPGHGKLEKAALWELEGRAGSTTLIFLGTNHTGKEQKRRNKPGKAAGKRQGSEKFMYNCSEAQSPRVTQFLESW